MALAIRRLISGIEQNTSLELELLLNESENPCNVFGGAHKSPKVTPTALLRLAQTFAVADIVHELLMANKTCKKRDIYCESGPF